MGNIINSTAFTANIKLILILKVNLSPYAIFRTVAISDAKLITKPKTVKGKLSCSLLAKKPRVLVTVKRGTKLARPKRIKRL